MESKDTTLEEIRVHCADKNDPERETLDIRKGRDNMKKLKGVAYAGQMEKLALNRSRNTLPLLQAEGKV